MSRRAAPLLIEDIWEAIEKIERYVSGLDHDAFIRDDKTVDSVVRNLEIIGEAANRIPENIRDRYSDIEWRKIQQNLIIAQATIRYLFTWVALTRFIGGAQFAHCYRPEESHRSRLFQHRCRNCVGDRADGFAALQIKDCTNPAI